MNHSEWLIGGGVTGELIRTMDWSKTPLGVREKWPQTLKTITDVVLSSSFAMAILWSSELILIYNDAYREIAGDRHPHAMGKSTREIWPEVWEFNKPIFDAVFKGQTIHMEDQIFHIRRNESMVDAYFTLSYSPIRLDANTIGGTLVTLLETTERQQAEGLLRESEERFRAIQDNSLDRFTILKPYYNEHDELVDFTYVYQNVGAARTTGFTPKELIGRRVTEIYPAFPQTRFFSAYKQVIENDEMHEFEDYYQADGVDEWFHAVVTRVPDGVAVATQIITERKQFEEALKASEERMNLALQATQDSVWDHNLETDECYYSPQWKAMLGYGDSEIEPHTSAWKRLLHPEDLPRAMEHVAGVMAGEHEYNIEFRMLHKDGHYVPILSRGFPIRHEPDGPVVRIVGTHSDLTERKQAHMALKQSEKRYRVLHETLRDPFVQTTMDGRISDFNDLYCEMLGYTPEEMRTLTYQELTPERWHTFEENLVREQIIPSGYSGVYEKEYRRKDGTTIPVELRTILSRDDDGNPETMWAIVRDITERKRSEEALRQSEERYKAVVNNTSAIILRVDPQLIIRYANPRALEFFGYSEDELVGKHAVGTIVPERETTGRDLKTMVEAIAANPSNFYSNSNENVRKNGERVWMKWTNSGVYDSEGNLEEFLSVGIDDTERKKAEEAYRESENKFKDLVEKSNAGVYLIQDRVHKYVNVKFAEIHGYDNPSEMIDNMGPEDTTHPDDWRSSEESMRLRQNGIRSQYRQFRIVRKDGEVRDVEVYGSQTMYGGRPAIIGTMLDITDRKLAEEELRKSRDELEKRIQERTAELSQAYEELQEQMRKREEMEENLRQSHKMEALGTLAGGIAHDFNNILGGLIGFAEMALEDTEGQANVQKSLNRVLQSATRAKDLVRQILTFSRKTNHQRTPVSFTPVIEDTIKLLRSSIPATTDIRFTSTARSDTVLASPTELQQIIMNLATNASLAMQPKGGILEVSLSDTFHPCIADSESPSGEYLQLIVKDTGVGMTREVMQRAFDPFFTTREPGKGTGMGLAVIYGIIKNMNGEIAVSSEPGEGCTFTIVLPKAYTQKVTEPEKPSEVLGGQETILYVEDEEMLNEWGKTVLESLGYTVHSFRDPEDALQAFSKDLTSFDIVITDYAMPKMAGSELASQMRKLRKDISIVLCTGYQDPTSFMNSEEMGITDILSKPLRKYEFATAVRRVLDREKSGR